MRTAAEQAELLANHPIKTYMNERREAEQCHDGLYCGGVWLPARMLRSDHLPHHAKLFGLEGLSLRADGTARERGQENEPDIIWTVEDVAEAMDETDTVCANCHQDRLFRGMSPTLED